MNRFLLFIALAAVSPARGGAQDVPAAPAGTPADAAPAPLELTPGLLARWGFDPDKVVALPPEKRAELQRQLTTLEIGRLRRLELLRTIRPGDWRDYVTDQELLTQAGMKLVDDYLAKLADKPLLVPAQIKEFARADGQPLSAEDFARARLILDRMFDGVAAHTGKDMSGEIVVDAHVRNETVYDMTLTNPRTGLSLSAGQLYVDDRFPVAAPSWYGNLTWNKDSRPDSGVDYRIKASLGYVDLHSRYFADGPSPAVPNALSLASQLGVPQSSLNQISKYTTYDDPYQTQGIVVSSLLAELGRAYPLMKSVDVSWTVGGLLKTMWVAPNAAFDETLGLRIRLKDGSSLGIFGGVAQNVSPVGNQLLQNALGNGTIAPGMYLENDPHVSAALWGSIPGASDLHYSVSATERWTPTTRVSEGEASLMTTFWSHPLALKAAVSRESGSGIEFERDKARLELDYHLSDRAQAYIAGDHDRVKYGDAEVDSNSILAGFRIELGGGSTVTADHLFGGRLKSSPLAPQLQQQLSKIQNDLNAALNVIDKANQAYDGLRPELGPGPLDAKLNQLSLALARLEPGAAQSLLSELGKRVLSGPQAAALSNLWLRTLSPGGAYYNQINGLIASSLAPGSPAAKDLSGALGKIDNWSSYFSAHEADMRRLIAMLTNEQVWDAAVIGAARGQLIAALQRYGKVSVPVLGRDFNLQIDAPTILAAANILQSRLSPLAPVTASQMNSFLMTEAGKSLGLSGTSFTSSQIAGGLFGLADAQMKQQLASALAPLVNDAANANPQQLAAKILAALPPNMSTLLKQNYGPNLTSLLPTGLPAGQYKNYLETQLPNQITTFLENRYGTQLATGIAQAVSWAGDLLSREVNMTLIQLMLASEELDRLTVDHGEKINDLDLRMAMRSFDQLDERGKLRSQDRVRAIENIVAKDAGQDEARLAEKFQTHGRTVLQTLELAPTWPAGLRFEIADESWLPLMTLYGDGPLFDLIERMKEQYRAKPRPDGLTIALSYREDRGVGVWVTRESATRLKIELTRPKDQGSAAFMLMHLENYVDERR